MSVLVCIREAETSTAERGGRERERERERERVKKIGEKEKVFHNNIDDM